MAKSDNLFLLIKALKKNEKRYFKIYASKYKSNGKKDYLKLFNAIDSQKVYNEKAIRQKFKNEPYFRQLKLVKPYLHRQILKSLRHFHEENSIDSKLSSLLLEIEILYQKELFDNCNNLIKKAKACALKYEKQLFVLKLIEWETKIADRTNDYQRIDQLKNNLVDDANDAINKYGEIIELRKIYIEGKAFFHAAGETRTPETITDIENTLKQPLLEKKMKTFHAEANRLIIRIQYAQLKRSFEGMHTEVEALLKLYEAHVHQLNENINAYFHLLLQLAISSINAKKIMIATQVFQKLKSIYLQKSNEIVIMNKMMMLQIEIYLLLEQGEFKQALRIVGEINALVEANFKKIGVIERTLVYYVNSGVYFSNGDFKTAQQYIQQIMSLDQAVRLDVQSSARIINLILQYEQQEYEHLGYVLRSTYRYLIKNQRLHKPETIILQFLRNTAKLSSEKQVLEALADLREQILPFTSEPFIIDFPLIAWIDSKLQKRSLAEIVKENYLKAVANEEAENNAAVGV